MLDFLPQRIGHACCFEEEEWKKLKSFNIPVRYLCDQSFSLRLISLGFTFSRYERKGVGIGFFNCLRVPIHHLF